MRVKQSFVVLLFALACFSLTAVAQDNSQTNITGGGKKGTIPVFTGSHTIGNSIVKQAGGTIKVAGAVSATGTVTATGVISGSSDVDAGGNVNATGNVNASGNVNAAGDVAATSYIFSSDFIEGPAVYGTNFGSFGTVFANQGDFSISAGRAVIAHSGDGTQELEGQQLAAASNSSYEYAFFDLNGTPVIWGDSLGDTVAKGSKSAAVPLKNGKMVKVYSQESPQVWFEDFGSASLVGGVATVKLESKYAQLVDTKVPYHVFLTPNGDCHGLYVAQKDQNSFEVRELNNGQSNVGFDYRISALRNGYETVRLEPTKMPTAGKAPQRPAAPKR